MKFYIKSILFMSFLGYVSSSLAQEVIINRHVKDGIQKIKITPNNIEQHNVLLEKAFITLLTLNDTNKVQQLLPFYAGLSSRNPTWILWADALLKAKKDPEQSIIEYTQLLENQPNLDVARLQLALLLLQNGDYFQGKRELYLLATQAPKNIQDIAKDYLNFLHPESHWEYDFSLSYLRDNNLTNIAPVGTRVDNLISTAKPESGVGVSYGLVASHNWELAPILGPTWNGLFTGISLIGTGKIYNRHAFDELDLSVAPRFGKQFNRITLGVSPFVTQSFYGGGTDGAGHLRREYYGVGTNFFTHFYASSHIRISPFIRLSQRHYQNDILKANITSYGVNMAYFLPKFRFELGGDYRSFMAHQGYDSYRQWNLYSGIEGEILKLGQAIRFDYSKRFYQAPIDPQSFISFFTKRRIDREWKVDYSIWYQPWQFKGFQPRLTFQYKKFRSTNVFKNHVKKQVVIQINKTF
ncbi:hypothetical protein A6A19_00205 [Actinobacillus delphinicola]|uniref:TPR repeat-containing protein NMB0313 n=1 Tax=Actinobacillus delphinicola TaxID=51161 RepID=A0A448TVM4_9PAST|nr:surface lipoprotein assembly modifier [Actinobacillus delphinicola]MDG6896467.1 hypothetical protein [Actinobacillus delphinicola]VEJ09979.1 TPR repeat-containing protein NMB0313 precursor [Actinobacillus delphinicola]